MWFLEGKWLSFFRFFSDGFLSWLPIHGHHQQFEVFCFFRHLVALLRRFEFWWRLDFFPNLNNFFQAADSLGSCSTLHEISKRTASCLVAVPFLTELVHVWLDDHPVWGQVFSQFMHNHFVEGLFGLLQHPTVVLFCVLAFLNYLSYFASNSISPYKYILADLGDYVVFVKQKVS